MAKQPEVRVGPVNSMKDVQQALNEIAQALNSLIAAFNETQEED